MVFWTEQSHEQDTPYEARMQSIDDASDGEDIDVEIHFVDDVTVHCGSSATGELLGCAPVVEPSEGTLYGAVDVSCNRTRAGPTWSTWSPTNSAMPSVSATTPISRSWTPISDR